MSEQEAERSIISDIEATLSLVARLDADDARREVARQMLTRLLSHEPLSSSTRTARG